MRKLYRILGKKGRITIPYEIRSRVGFSYNDVLSFTEQDDRTVVVRREKICGDCRSNPKTPTEKVSEGITLLQFLDDLSKSEQRAALIHLSVKWAEQQEEDSHAYDGFNGKEFIFGGTALERENGNQLKVTYTLTVEEGTAELYWVAGNDEYTIANDSAEDTKEYTISSGDNYIVLKGNDFSGSLKLEVK